MNYTYNHPTPFIETNIRTVYFYHFFAEASAVTDKQLLNLVATTMDQDNPCQWFWALMDYGTELKRQGRGRLTTSRHYKKQSRFEGSLRQMRGEIITLLAEKGTLTEAELRQLLGADQRFTLAIEGLQKDQLVTKKGKIIQLHR